ncbi:ubiquitin carboxyl-terminal hydrolase 32-like [Styela clava]
MGGKDSKLSILSYEDAANRVTKTEFARLQKAYKSACGFSGSMTENVLIKDVLGDFVPTKLAQRLFAVMASSSRGMTQRDMITTLVLLTRGKQEERLKLIYAVYADNSGLFVTRRSMALMETACEGTALPHEAAELFTTTDRVPAEVFCDWIKNHSDITSVTKWLLNSGGVTVSLTDSTEMANFYQTLAGVTHLEESDIIDLEKHYWTLKSQSKTGRFDLQLFKSIVCPPLPESIVKGLFDAFDQNGDNHIDFKEISCGVSACCRGPLAERQKFCFKVFDKDQDGKLNSEELKFMAKSFLEVKCMTRNLNSEQHKNANIPQSTLISNKGLSLTLTSATSENTVVRNAQSPIAAVPPVIKVASSKFFDNSSSMSASRTKILQKTNDSTVNNNSTEECKSNEISNEQPNIDEINMVVSSALQYAVDREGSLTLEEYQMWGMDDIYPNLFLNITIEICHIVLGLRPSSPEEEGMIIRGWMQRCDYHDVNPGETWYVVAEEWWNKWKKHTTYDPILSPSRSRKWEHEALESDVDVTHDRSSSTDTISSAIEASESFYHANLAQHKSHKLRLPSKKKSKSKENISTVSGGVTSQASKVNNSPGPIVNTSILIEENHKVATITDEGGKLKDTIVCEEDFELIPEPVWKALHHWYGGRQVLPRIVPVPIENDKAEIELYRLHVLLLKHQTQPLNQQNIHIFSGNSAIAEVGNATFGMLKSSLNYVIGSNSSPKRYLAYRATFSRRHTIKQVQTFLAIRIHMYYDNIRLWNYIDENNAFVMEEETATLEDFGVKDNSQVLIEVRNMDMSWPEEMSQLAKNKKIKPKPAIEKGVTGLSNIGNTCFMNSGLQCISNTRPLTQYFMMNKHFYELNRSNPLGMKGHIAKRYGDLVQELWSGKSKSTAPLKLRWTISKYAPRFNGFSQHDSQELLSFLLDGLHEDLNRVEEKPYVELKDSDGRPDEEVAQEAWENHLMRNQSVIVDLFHGQIRSQVRCMECNNLSVRFDPFTFLSLPLPMDNSMYLDVILVKLNCLRPMKYGLQLNMEEKYYEVRTRLSALCDVECDRLLLVEISGARIKSFVSDNHKVRTGVVGGLYAFEIPAPQILDIESPNVRNKTHKESNHVNGGIVTNKLPEKPEARSTLHESKKTSITNLHAIYKENESEGSLNKDLIEMNGMPGDELSSATITSFAVGGDCDNLTTVPITEDGLRNRQLMNGDIRSSIPLSASDSTISSTTSKNTITQITSQCYVIAFHRKMFHQELYFLSPQKIQRSLFGVPVVVPCMPGNSKKSLYENVWNQVSRFVSPLGPNEVANHAQDCDNSLQSQYPFLLRSVKRCGMLCGEGCPWYKFCCGCVIECNDESYFPESGYIAIDWDPTALHLRYQPSVERDIENHETVDQGTQGQRKPIDLDHCLKAFTTEEELGADELYYCGKCKKHQLAKKKLDIWRLPPILIIHLKRFQFVNGRWIKSHKIVNVEKNDFDPSKFTTKKMKEAVVEELPSETGISQSSLNEVGDDPVKSDKRIKFADENDSGKVGGKPGPAGDGSDMSHTNTSSNSGRHSAGPARQRKPSFREEEKPLFDLFAVSCHTGILCGGHYVSYAKNPNSKWYCYNDSSCKEVKEDEISIDTSYILFYERQGLDYDDFMPQTDGRNMIDTTNMDDDFNSEYKKYCSIQ